MQTNSPELYPAIDVRGGKCVRLQQGDYARETTYGEDPVAVAVSFAEAGARWIHTVDLDAARSGDGVNRSVIAAIAAAVAPFGAKVQTGGGVRNPEAVRDLSLKELQRQLKKYDLSMPHQKSTRFCVSTPAPPSNCISASTICFPKLQGDSSPHV